MSLPTQSKIELPLLKLIYESEGKIEAKDCYQPLAQYFNLTLEEQNEPKQNGESRWKNRVQWAKQNLIAYKYLYKKEYSGRGVWEITPLGISKVEELLCEGDKKEHSSLGVMEVTLLDKSKVKQKNKFTYSNDVDEFIYEGNLKESITNTYERNKAARMECINHHGCKCSVCDLDFEKKYGEIGKDFIHVHHILPLSQISVEHIVNPIEDLCPVCPNCHAMMHKRENPFSIKEMKEILLGEENKQEQSALSKND